jgi:PAS domain-containing protein
VPGQMSGKRSTLGLDAPLVRYALPLLMVAAATALTWGLRVLGLEDPSAAFLAAILLSAWYAGPGPTVLAVVLSAVAWTFFVEHPVSSFSMGGPLAPHVVIFTLFAAVAAWFVSVRQQAAKRVEQARDELEERVRERTAHLDELFEQAPEAIALLETDGTIARVNREFTRLFGYRPEEAVGRGIDALLVPSDSPTGPPSAASGWRRRRSAAPGTAPGYKSPSWARPSSWRAGRSPST